jgi:serine protease Do
MRQPPLSRLCHLALIIGLASIPLPAVAQVPHAPSLAAVTEQVNQKVVKLYGAGGYRGLANYGTGILVSADGHVLTAHTPLLEAGDVRVHLADGRRYNAKVVVAEPELDAALLKIEEVADLPHFDVAAAAKRPTAPPGTWVLGFTNQFEIATRDEAATVQHGVVAAFTKLQGRRGVFEAAYAGDVYFVDAITNNPGSPGGALTTRTGDLLGLVGKELQNKLTDTYINYAVPVKALAEFVEKGVRGEYKPVAPREKVSAGPAGYHGIVLVPDVVERTPPFVEEVRPDSPGARAGLRPDDLVVYVDGEQVGSVKDFRAIVGKAPPGTAFKLEVRRGDRLVSTELKLDAPPTPAAKK